eukprot:59517-Rhodomonas_salina.2
MQLIRAGANSTWRRARMDRTSMATLVPDAGSVQSVSHSTRYPSTEHRPLDARSVRDASRMCIACAATRGWYRTAVRAYRIGCFHTGSQKRASHSTR